jgi:hypothetical protein
LPFAAVRRPADEFGPPNFSRFSRVSGIGCMLATCEVALALCPMSLAEAALASVPEVVALGVLMSELEVDGELDVVDELSLLVPDGMLLLLLLLLSLGCSLLDAAPELVSLGWLLVDCA